MNKRIGCLVGIALICAMSCAFHATLNNNRAIPKPQEAVLTTCPSAPGTAFMPVTGWVPKGTPVYKPDSQNRLQFVRLSKGERFNAQYFVKVRVKP